LVQVILSPTLAVLADGMKAMLTSLTCSVWAALPAAGAAVEDGGALDELELEPQASRASAQARAAHARTASLIGLAAGAKSHMILGLPAAGKAPSRIVGPMPRHFLTGAELQPAELDGLVTRALELKRSPRSSRALEDRIVALIFERPSTRTRITFEVGVVELGGDPLVLRSDELQLSRGESVRDTALVLSRHVDLIGLRTGSDATLQELAANATVPVVNMLSPEHHPCQALADLVTMREAFGTLEGRRLAYVGDGNNVARSLAIVGHRAGIEVVVSSPSGYRLEPGSEPDPGLAAVSMIEDPRAAVEGASVVYTDVWVSMGDEEQASQRRRDLAAYRVDDALLDAAAPDVIALHCLPAHPGEEITAEVLYGERQGIWDQAENRRHAQKALLELLIA
jgi:ornithine carbamoyltransferase